MPAAERYAPVGIGLAPGAPFAGRSFLRGRAAVVAVAP